MSRLKLEIPHTLGKAEAATRLKEQLEKRRDEFQQHVSDLETTWAGEELAFSFSAIGFHVGGTLAVDDDCVKIDAQLPLPAMLFRGKIEQTIQDELGQLLIS